jgi:hypothetical protein
MDVEYVQNNFEEQLNGHGDPTMGWSRVASAIEVQMVPGGHLSCVSTHVKILATRMKTYLETMQTNKAGALARGSSLNLSGHVAD